MILTSVLEVSQRTKVSDVTRDCAIRVVNEYMIATLNAALSVLQGLDYVYPSDFPFKSCLGD